MRSRTCLQVLVSKKWGHLTRVDQTRGKPRCNIKCWAMNMVNSKTMTIFMARNKTWDISTQQWARFWAGVSLTLQLKMTLPLTKEPSKKRIKSIRWVWDSLLRSRITLEILLTSKECPKWTKSLNIWKRRIKVLSELRFTGIWLIKTKWPISILSTGIKL